MSTLTVPKPVPRLGNGHTTPRPGTRRVPLPQTLSRYAADAALFLAAYHRCVANAADMEHRGARGAAWMQSNAKTFMREYKYALFRPASVPEPRHLPGLRVLAHAVNARDH